MTVPAQIRNYELDPFFAVNIHLSGLTTLTTLKAHILALAEAYSEFMLRGEHPRRHCDPAGEFCVVRSRAPSEELMRRDSVGFAARLFPGWSDELVELNAFGFNPDHRSGFTASIEETHTMTSDGRYAGWIWSRTFPVK